MTDENHLPGVAQGAVESVSLTELARRHAATWGDHSPSSVSMLAAFGKSLLAAQPPTAPVETEDAIELVSQIIYQEASISHYGDESEVDNSDYVAREVLRALARKHHSPCSAGNADLESIYAALSQAQDCIRGETPEDISDEAAREDTIDKVRDAMRLIEHMQAQPQAVEVWQPVETAPHETRVILGWWSALGDKWECETGYASHGWRRNGISTMSRHGQATHWQPLPSPLSRPHGGRE